MEQRGLDHFSQLLNLLLTSTDITVGHIRLLLHLRHGNKELLLQLSLESAEANIAILHVILVKS